MGAKPSFGLNPTDSSVEQQLDAASFHIDAVAVAAGLERDNLHCRIVLRTGELGQSFPLTGI
jgi:hypothetical protein